MILELTPILTPCCHRLAMRSVMTTINLDSTLLKPVANDLRKKTTCPHCGSKIARDEGQPLMEFHGRMRQYIVAGVPELEPPE